MKTINPKSSLERDLDQDTQGDGDGDGDERYPIDFILEGVESIIMSEKMAPKVL